MRLGLGLAQATRAYQSDSSSKRPVSSVVSNSKSQKTKASPTRERRRP
jgi:hypothetical protein